MQCDVCGGVIYKSNKSKYLKTEMRYAKAVKTNLYNFKSSFKYEGFLQTNVFISYIPFNSLSAGPLKPGHQYPCLK